MTPSEDQRRVAADCILQRAGDPVHWMQKHGLTLFLAQGTTPNGTPATVIIATGDANELARQVGEAMAKRMEEHRRLLDDESQSN